MTSYALNGTTGNYFVSNFIITNKLKEKTNTMC